MIEIASRAFAEAFIKEPYPLRILRSDLISYHEKVTVESTTKTFMTLLLDESVRYNVRKEEFIQVCSPVDPSISEMHQQVFKEHPHDQHCVSVANTTASFDFLVKSLKIQPDSFAVLETVNRAQIQWVPYHFNKILITESGLNYWLVAEGSRRRVTPRKIIKSFLHQPMTRSISQKVFRNILSGLLNLRKNSIESYIVGVKKDTLEFPDMFEIIHD